MSALHFDENLVMIMDDEGLDTYEVEERLAQRLLTGGWVKESYPAALHEREKGFPTGLYAQGINVAIPHCDPEHVEHGSMAVGILKHPVAWRRMEDPAATCEVSLVVMLGLEEAHAHMEMLQKVIALVQDQEQMAHIVACDNATDAYAMLKGAFE